MKRREFVALLGGAAATWPLTARAQQPAMPMIGFLNSGSPQSRREALDAFHRGLAEVGFIEGQNVAIEYRWAEGQNDRLSALAADLVRRQMTMIATGGNEAVLAAKKATTTIPIVFATASDPVAVGFVSSLNRPGGNVTGATFLGMELMPKRLQLLHELVPSATIVALLVNPTNPTSAEPITRDLQMAARSLGLQLHVLQASTERDFDTAFETLVQLRARALVIGTDAFFNGRSIQLAALTLRHTVPAIFQRDFALGGGLMSYDASSVDAYRLAGVYSARILKGEKPADLPVQQSTKVELILNLKTAKTLGISIPLSLLARADEVIE
jgi:putative ABC transport system substrate-binding protein